MKITASTLPKLLVLVATVSLALPIQNHKYPITLPYTTKEIRCLVDNVYHEARGESYWGQVLVAKVTLNRAALSEQSLCQTVYAPKQFSWTLKKQKPINRKSNEYTTAFNAAAMAFRIQFPALYYHNLGVHPKWAKAFTKVATYGNHTFYQ